MPTKKKKPNFTAAYSKQEALEKYKEHKGGGVSIDHAKAIAKGLGLRMTDIKDDKRKGRTVSMEEIKELVLDRVIEEKISEL